MLKLTLALVALLAAGLLCGWPPVAAFALYGLAALAFGWAGYRLAGLFVE